VETSRPPVYSPELTALLTSEPSRSTKPLTPGRLKSPHTLPERANPNSEEARLIGRLSKRREVNIRWRFFASEWKKVYPPLQISMDEVSKSYEHLRTETQQDGLAAAGIRGVGLQGTGVMEEIVAMAGLPWTPPIPSKRQRWATLEQGADSPEVPSKTVVPRFLRRQYQDLLGRLPVLTYIRRVGEEVGTKGKGKYEVSLASNALIRPNRNNLKRRGVVDDVDLAWLEVGQSSSPSERGHTKKNNSKLEIIHNARET
jgi:hypothetical protein